MSLSPNQYDTGGEVYKIDIIQGAYSKLRISGLTTKPTPEDVEVALDSLESIAAEFSTRNMSGGYIFEDLPDSSSPSGVPRKYKRAYEYALAQSLAADFNKQLPPTFFASAASAISSLSSAESIVRHVAPPTRQPRGSGTRRWEPYRRFYGPDNRAPANEQTIPMYKDNENSFVEHFDTYLRELEDIDTFTINSDDGLTVLSSSNDTPDIGYSIRADKAGRQRVRIDIVTTDGRKETRLINFQVSVINGL